MIIMTTTLLCARRVYYALWAIVPPIIAVMVGFTTFVVSKDKYTDRLKCFTAILVPVYIFQYSINVIQPRTFTLLSPSYLVFVAIIVVMLQVLVATVSFLIVNRQASVEG